VGFGGGPFGGEGFGDGGALPSPYGILNAYCEDSRTLRVIFSTAPAQYGPRHVLRRQAWDIVLSDGDEVRLGMPYLDADEPRHVLLPVDVPWSPDATIDVTVTAEDTQGHEYTNPDTFQCAALPELERAARATTGRPPRDDLATDPDTGGLVIQGGTYVHHWGRVQLRKVLVRLLTDRTPRGLGITKDIPITRDVLERYRARAREIVAAQEGVQAARVDVEWSRADGIIRVIVDVRTPDAWETFDLALNPALGG